MTRDEKIEFHRQVSQIEGAVLEMNGPYSQTSQTLKMLSTLRDAWLEDDIIYGCEHCEEPIFESEAETAVSSEDGCWFCSACAAKWVEQEAQSN